MFKTRAQAPAKESSLCLPILNFATCDHVRSWGLYRGQVSHDLRHQERQQANRLASDLNWSSPTTCKEGRGTEEI